MHGKSGRSYTYLTHCDFLYHRVRLGDIFEFDPPGRRLVTEFNPNYELIGDDKTKSDHNKTEPIE